MKPKHSVSHIVPKKKQEKTMKKTMLIVLIALLAVGAVFANGGKESESDMAPAAGEEKIKAGFIYIGPAGDFGWTYAHDQGRIYAEEQLPWLETVVVESVPEGDAVRFIDRLVQEQKSGCGFHHQLRLYGRYRESRREISRREVLSLLRIHEVGEHGNLHGRHVPDLLP
jgi:hypothetical protein